MTGLYSPKKAKKKRLEVPKSGFKTRFFWGAQKRIWPKFGPRRVQKHAKSLIYKDFWWGG